MNLTCFDRKIKTCNSNSRRVGLSVLFVFSGSFLSRKLGDQFFLGNIFDSLDRHLVSREYRGKVDNTYVFSFRALKLLIQGKQFRRNKGDVSCLLVIDTHIISCHLAKQKGM